jgi:cytochrome c oxidase subunit 1
MGLFFGLFLPLLERDLNNGNFAKASAWFYAVGQILHSSGLFWAGGYGAPRKVAGADQGVEALGASMGLYLMGIGAVIAVIGGVMFIYLVTQALLKKV